MLAASYVTTQHALRVAPKRVRVLLGCGLQTDRCALDFPGAPLRGALCVFTQ